MDRWLNAAQRRMIRLLGDDPMAVRIVDALDGARIRTIPCFENAPEQQLESITGIGTRSMARIREARRKLSEAARAPVEKEG